MTVTLLESTEKLNSYVSDCIKNGVKILPVDINKSSRGFTAEQDGIRFALIAVKSLGEGAIASIIREREENGVFRSLQNFCTRMTGREVTTKGVEQLIKSGAMDCFPNNRREMINSYEALIQSAAQESKANLAGQLDFFGMGISEPPEKVIEPAEEYSHEALLEFEHEALGMYISGHPLDEYMPAAYASCCTEISRLYQCASENVKGFCDGDSADIVAMITHIKTLKTKKGDIMCFVQAEDRTGAAEIIVFPNVYQISSSVLKNGAVVHVKGRISVKEDENPKLICELAETVQRFEEQAMKKGVCVRALSGDKALIERIRKTAASAGEGRNRLTLYFADLNKTTAFRSLPSVALTKKLLIELQQAAGEKNVLFMQ